MLRRFLSFCVTDVVYQFNANRQHMNDLCGLYDEEDRALFTFRKKIDRNRITRGDLNKFVENYHELLVQSKVITKVSDKLQSKLNRANERIREQNEEIVQKNVLLENTIGQLVKAKMGKKASTVIFTVAVVMFLSEEVFLGEAIAVMVHIQYLDIVLKASIAFTLKLLEGGLEAFYMKKEQLKIVKAGKADNPTQTKLSPVADLKLSPYLNKLLCIK